MDEVLQHIIEEIAYDGVSGTALERVWQFLAALHTKQNQEQTIDSAYKTYILGLISQCPEILISTADASCDTQDTRAITEDKAVLCRQDACDRSDILLYTTQSRQWYALTGHDVDHKQIAPMAFALICVISRHREDGITLPELCRESGQDKRSAPQRCNVLASLGLIKGFPVLAHKAHTTRYVHKKFLDENVLKRQQQDDFGQAHGEIDTQALRLAISNALSEAKSNILKVEDLYRLIGMTNDTNELSRRRARNEVICLANAGYIDRVQVPGQRTGNFIKCYQLKRVYEETDEALRYRDRQSNLKDDLMDDIENDFDEELQANDEELDVSLAKNAETWRTCFEMNRNLLLDLQIQRFIACGGSDGKISHQIGWHTVGPFWLRPFDEVLKRLGPAISAQTQPLEHYDLAIAPPLDEVKGKTHQYRYITMLASGLPLSTEISSRLGQFSNFDLKTISAKCGTGSKAPVEKTIKTAIFNHASHIEGPSVSKSLSSSSPGTARKSEKRPHIEDSSITPRKRGRPTKQMLADRKAEALSRAEPDRQGPQPLRSSDTPPPTLQSDKTHEVETEKDMQPMLGPLSNIDPLLSKTSSQPLDDTMALDDAPSTPVNSQIKLEETPSNLQSSPEHHLKSVPGRRLPAKRAKILPSDRHRAQATSSTAARRRQILLQIIEQKGGITLFEAALLNEYNRVANETHGEKQTSDRKTVRNALEDLDRQGAIHIRTRMLCKERAANENDPMSTIIKLPMKKIILCLRTIDPAGPEVDQFCKTIEDLESAKRKIYVPPKPDQIIARPEMEIIPTTHQTDRRLAQMAKMKIEAEAPAAKEDYLKFRAQLPSNPLGTFSSSFPWQRDGSALPDLAEVRAEQQAAREARKQQARAEREAKNKKAIKKPVLKPMESRLFRAVAPQNSESTQMLPPASPARPPVTKVHAPTKPDLSPVLKSRVAPTLATTQIKSPTRRSSTTRKREPMKPIVRRGDSVCKVESAEEVQTASDSPLRRKRFNLSDSQEDILVRAAALSMLFFSKSDGQPIIQWPLVVRCIPDVEEDVLKRRHSSMRSNQNHRAKQSFIMSLAFVQVYNRAVRARTLRPIPKGADMEQFDLLPYVRFSRQFDVSMQAISQDRLPSTLDKLCSEYDITPLKKKSDHEWRDKAFELATNINKYDAFKSSALCVVDERDDTDEEALRIAAVKANLLTPDKDFNTTRSTEFMARYGSKQELHATLETLLANNTIVPVKGDLTRLAPNCNFQLSEKTLFCLKHANSPRDWKQANNFEAEIAHHSARSIAVSFPTLATDGQTMAAVELAARQQLSLVAESLPFNEAGVIDGYEVKKIDAMTLDFDVKLTLRDCEAGPEPKLTCHYPDRPVCWYDINKNLLPSLHASLTSLAIQFTIQRGLLVPGEFLRSTKPFLLIHEVHALLTSLCQSGILEAKEDVFYLRRHYYHAMV